VGDHSSTEEQSQVQVETTLKLLLAPVNTFKILVDRLSRRKTPFKTRKTVAQNRCAPRPAAGRKKTGGGTSNQRRGVKISREFGF
jgi:hypothetical protein